MNRFTGEVVELVFDREVVEKSRWDAEADFGLQEAEEEIPAQALETDVTFYAPEIKALVRGYNPDQPRDDNGRWGSGGGTADPDGSPSWPAGTIRLTDDEGKAARAWFGTQWAGIAKADDQGKQTPRLNAFLSACSKCPDFDGVAHRGIRLTDAEAEKLAGSKTIAINGVRSFTQDVRIAEEFSRPITGVDEHKTSRVVLSATMKGAKDVARIAAASGRTGQEVVQRRATFNVKKVTKTGNITYIHMVQAND